jgi:hypothetical protein
MVTEQTSLGEARSKVSPIKVDAATKERIRLAAAFLGIEQGEFVRRLVVEYIASSKSLPERVEEARAALLGGDEAMVAYLRGDE